MDACESERDCESVLAELGVAEGEGVPRWLGEGVGVTVRDTVELEEGVGAALGDCDCDGVPR